MKNSPPSTPNAVWCTDITYIWTYDGFVYLTTINKAKAIRNVKAPLIIHSDRGIQYTCEAYRKATRDMITSYSKRLIHGIMHASNHFMLLLKENG